MTNENKLNLKFFLTFIGAVAYLHQELFENFSQKAYITSVDPGMHTTVCKRTWEVGGIEVEDEVVFPMENQIHISGIVGHKHDFSTLIVWGESAPEELDNPKVASYWQTEMKVWKAPKNYHLGNSKPRFEI